MAQQQLFADEYKVNLDVFEGPLDLLLYLIRREELDIYDIPIEHITAEYMKFINEAREMNLDIAGEFIVMAATLMVIKSRMALLKKMCMTFLPKHRPTAKQCIRDIKKRKKFFLPLHKADKRFFFVITHHLYLPYKLLYRFAKKVKKG